MASFHCYKNSDVIATLITTTFHLYLIHLWGQLFQMFVYGDVVYAQTWQVLTLKNCMEPFSYASTAYLVASALVSVRLFCKNLGNLQEFFGQMVYRPPLAKNSPYAYAPFLRGIDVLFSRLKWGTVLFACVAMRCGISEMLMDGGNARDRNMST